MVSVECTRGGCLSGLLLESIFNRLYFFVIVCSKDVLQIFFVIGNRTFIFLIGGDLLRLVGLKSIFLLDMFFYLKILIIFFLSLLNCISFINYIFLNITRYSDKLFLPCSHFLGLAILPLDSFSLSRLIGLVGRWLLGLLIL